MDIKEIAAKELNGEDVSTLISAFTDDQQKEYSTTFLGMAKEAKTKELAEVSALRKAKADLQDKTKSLTDEDAKKYQEQHRSEQIGLARTRIVAELGLTAEQATALDESFKTEDSGKASSDLIYADFKRAYVKSDPDGFINAKKKAQEFEKGAAEAMADAAGGGSNNNGGTPPKTYSPQVYEYVKEAQKQGIALTLEQAEKGLSFGSGWNVPKAK